VTLDRRQLGLGLAGLGVLSGPASAMTPALERLTVRGGRLVAYVAPSHGGELVGLGWRAPDREVELLHRGRDLSPAPDWRGKAPILWPAVGRNFGGGTSETLGWTHGGVFRPMPIHGFAKDMPWQRFAARAPAGGAALGVRLRDTPETRRSYPFGFTLEVTYTLQRDRIELRHRVSAARGNGGAMPFSMGNHITFNAPLSPRGDATRMTLETPARRQVMTDAAGRPTGEVRNIAEQGPRLLAGLKPRTALSLSGYAPGQVWVRLTEPGGLAVTVSHRADRWPDGEPVLFNLWGDLAAGFFSPEPWVGKQNSLVTGDGLIRLAAGADFAWTIRVEVAEA